MSPEFTALVKEFGLKWAVIIFLAIVIWRGIKKGIVPWAQRVIGDLSDTWKKQQEELNRARIKSFEDLSAFVRQEGEKNSQVLESLKGLTAEVRAMRQDRKRTPKQQ